MDITANTTFLKNLIKYFNKYHFTNYTIKNIDSIEICDRCFHVIFDGCKEEYISILGYINFME